jgi:hypothetical protein
MSNLYSTLYVSSESEDEDELNNNDDSDDIDDIDDIDNEKYMRDCVNHENFIPILEPNEIYAKKVGHNYTFSGGHSPICDGCGNCDCFPCDTILYGYKYTEHKKSMPIMVCKKCADAHQLTILYAFIISTYDCKYGRNYECEKCNTVYNIKYQVNEMNDKMYVRCNNPYGDGVFVKSANKTNINWKYINSKIEIK